MNKISDDRKLADYAMVLELMGSLAGLETEQKVADGIIELFRALCGPKLVEYVPVHASGAFPLIDEEHNEALFRNGGYMPLKEGFVLRVGNSETLAYVRVEGVMFPEYMEHYLNLALSMRGVLEISVGNARNYQKLLRAKERLRAEKERTQSYASELERYKRRLEELVEERTDELVREIEARKAVEQELRRSEAEFRGIVDNAIAGIFRSSEGKILYANRALAEMFGFESAEEMVRQGASCPCVDERYRGLFKEGLCSSGALDNMEVEIRTRTGERRVVLLSSNIQDRVLTSVVMDITGLKDAQEKLEFALSELARSNKDLQQFAYIASHDLSEPLRVITGYLKILLRKYGNILDKKGLAYVDYALDGSVKMEKTIADLLEFSRIQTQAKPMAEADSGAALDDAVKNLGAAISESNAVVTHGPMPIVYADGSQLARVFQNLVANAIKFRGADPPKVRIDAVTSAQEWVFSVADNGIGIRPEHREKVFEMFTRVHPEYKGSGIGLASCKRIVERHGGRIWVESEPGLGSTFKFTIPSRKLSRRDAPGPGKAA